MDQGNHDKIVNMITIECAHCKKNFKARPCVLRRGSVNLFCSIPCKRRFYSLTQSVLLNCETCGEMFKADLNWAKSGARFCSRSCIRHTEEAKKKIKKNHARLSGENASNWSGGKPLCMHCGERKKSYIGKYCGHCAKLGDRCPHWKGGKTKLFKSIRNSKKYKKWRLFIISNNKLECSVCSTGGVIGKELFVDHIIALSDIMKKYSVSTIKQAYLIPEIWDVSNGRILCRSCHDKTETSLRLFFKKNVK